MGDLLDRFIGRYVVVASFTVINIKTGKKRVFHNSEEAAQFYLSRKDDTPYLVGNAYHMSNYTGRVYFNGHVVATLHENTLKDFEYNMNYFKSLTTHDFNEIIRKNDGFRKDLDEGAVMLMWFALAIVALIVIRWLFF